MNNTELPRVFDKILSNIVKNRTNVHGYILYGENKEDLKTSALLLSKALICNKEFKINCQECNICKRIDDGNYTEIKIINPINDNIKKEEILNLKDFFAVTSIEGRNQVYIINDAEYLNLYSANSLLKFLEEPENNIIGIFTTTNLNKMYDTIISRCQVIRLFNDQKEDVFNSKLLNSEDIDYIINYLGKLEDDSVDILYNTKNEFLTRISNKESLIDAFYVMLLVYKDAMNLKLGNSNFLFSKSSDVIKKLADQNSIKTLSKKISFILENIEKLSYNVNVLLFMFNFIIGIGEIKND